MAGLDQPTVYDIIEGGTETLEGMNLNEKRDAMNEKLNVLGYSYDVVADESYSVFTITLGNLKGMKRTFEFNAPSSALNAVNDFISGKLQGKNVINIDHNLFPGYTYQEITGDLQSTILSNIQDLQK